MGGLNYLVRWGATLVLFVFVAEVAKGWIGQWIMLLHGKTRLLQLAEFINGGEVAPLLSVVNEAAPCCGAVSTAVSSTSRPACQSGGPSATPSWRSSSLRRQVVSSPTAAPTAMA